MKIKPILNFKDVNIINSYRFAKYQEPIMSFQTSYNGTFNPVITPTSGILIWEVDGVKQETNTPSFSLIGDTVDVNVYANDVSEAEQITLIDMDNLSLSGVIDLDYFTVNGSVDVSSNVGLTNILFRNANNTFTGQGLQVDSCAFSSLDVSRCTFVNATFNFQGMATLTSLNLGNNVNTISIFRGTNCRLTSLDMQNTSVTTFFQMGFNYNLASYNKGTGTINAINFEIMQNNLTSLDLSNVTCLGLFYCYNNTGLTTIINASYTTAFGDYRAYNCALNQSSVDGIYASLNAFFSANTPIKNLSVRTDLGTNSSPTNGASNADIVNLDTVVYPNAGFSFTYAIN